MSLGMHGRLSRQRWRLLPDLSCVAARMLGMHVPVVARGCSTGHHMQWQRTDPVMPLTTPGPASGCMTLEAVQAAPAFEGVVPCAAVEASRQASRTSHLSEAASAPAEPAAQHQQHVRSLSCAIHGPGKALVRRYTCHACLVILSCWHACWSDNPPQHGSWLLQSGPCSKPDTTYRCQLAGDIRAQPVTVANGTTTPPQDQPASGSAAASLLTIQSSCQQGTVPPATPHIFMATGLLALQACTARPVLPGAFGGAGRPCPWLQAKP